jgi:hypothetical protein
VRKLQCFVQHPCNQQLAELLEGKKWPNLVEKEDLPPPPCFS